MDALQMAHELMMWPHGAGILPHMPMHMMPM